MNVCFYRKSGGSIKQELEEKIKWESSAWGGVSQKRRWWWKLRNLQCEWSEIGGPDSPRDPYISRKKITKFLLDNVPMLALWWKQRVGVGSESKTRGKADKVSSDTRGLNCESFVIKYLMNKDSLIEIWILHGVLYKRSLNQAIIPSYTLSWIFTLIPSAKCISSMPATIRCIQSI